MYLIPKPLESSGAAAIPLSDLRELIHTLRNRAQREFIHAETCRPGATRERHAWRAEAFVEAADIIERCAGLRDEK
jgi:hypothetical protein